MLENVLKSQINAWDKLLQLIMGSKQAYSLRHQLPLSLYSAFHIAPEFMIVGYFCFRLNASWPLSFVWMSCKMRGLGCQSAYMGPLGLISASECSVITRVCKKKGQGSGVDAQKQRNWLSSKQEEGNTFLRQTWVKFQLELVLIRTGGRSEKTMNKIQHAVLSQRESMTRLRRRTGTFTRSSLNTSSVRKASSRIDLLWEGIIFNFTICFFVEQYI